MEKTLEQRIEEINDSPILYANGGGYGHTHFSISADPDPENPEVNLHAHRSGVGGMFCMKPSVARELASWLIAAADVVDEATKAKAA